MPQASIIGRTFIFFISPSVGSHGAAFSPVGHVPPGSAEDLVPTESAVNAFEGNEKR
jgi:hypothetical protein